MTKTKKSAIAAVALMGVLLGTVAQAEKGGRGDREDRGAMMMQMFETMDADKDGKVSIAEMEAHRKAEFASADTNSDGALSADELSARALVRFQEDQAARTQRMLDHMDKDGNGSLSEDELGEGPGERHFARIDADDDGMISKEEIEAGMKHRKKRGNGEGMSDN